LITLALTNHKTHRERERESTRLKVLISGASLKMPLNAYQLKRTLTCTFSADLKVEI